MVAAANTDEHTNSLNMNSSNGIRMMENVDESRADASSGSKKALSPIEPPSESEPSEAQRDTLAGSLTKRQKWFLVGLVSLAGTFSPLSSNIYFPATSSIAEDLHTSLENVALTITVYMIVQGIAPSFFAALSESTGRRITLVTSLIVYIGANLGLAVTSSFPMLLVLRGLQAAGSSATISISAGVISDIASASERGGFVGTNTGMRMMGQAIGPVIGGLLNSAWGFRSIFWFLLCLSSLVLILLVAFLPETHRDIAGPGAKLSVFHRPLVFFTKPPKRFAPAASSVPQMKLPDFRKIVEPLKHALRKDILVLLCWGAIVYTLWSMVTASTTTALLHTFPRLNQWQIGLCFLPNGIGCILGSISTGWLLDRTFKRMEAEHRKQKPENGTPPDAEAGFTKSEFPLERARLQLMPWFSALFILSLALYGPAYEFNDLKREFAPNLVASLGTQFIIAFTATGIFNINSTMLIDSFPDSAAAATATNNLCRCLLGALGVSLVQRLIDAVKIRNAFLILAGVAILFSPLVWVQLRYSTRWRLQAAKAKEEK